MSKVNHADVIAMATTLKEQITIADGKATIAEGAYVGTLPEGITVESINALNAHNSVFYPAVTMALGEKSIDAFKKDKTLESITLETPLTDRNHFDVTMSRKSVFHNPKSKDGEEIVKWGTVRSQLVTQAARASKGEMSKVCDLLGEMALAALSK